MLHLDEIGSGPAIGLVHGFTQTRRSWEPIVDHIQDATLKSVDLPGHGLSDLRVPSFGETARAIVETIGSGCYVGYSMGARLCLRAALDHPESVTKLILIAGTPGIEDERARGARLASDLALADRIESIGLRAFLDEWLSQPIFSDIDHDSEEYRLENTAIGLASALRRLGTGAMESMWSALGSMQVPTLIIVGGLDRKFVDIGHEMQERIPGSRIAIVEDAGHAAHRGSPDEVTELIREFAG
ncbi:MAG TPA: alpha/beta fold hydrolase [Actinomycetota bacterium]|nr:alpha/beta fold hydrolase [Actinomycetota bacterium]